MAPSSEPSSPMECEYVFPFDEEDSVQTPVPWEQSAAAAVDSLRQLESLLEPATEPELMVSNAWQLPTRDRRPPKALSDTPLQPAAAQLAAAAGRQADLTAPPLPPTCLPQLARHVELAAGGAHRVDCDALCAVLQRLGYSAKLHDSSSALHKFRRGVRHQFISVCLPGVCEGSQAGPCRRYSLPAPLHCTDVLPSLRRPAPQPSLTHRPLHACTPAHACADASLTGLATYIVEPNFKDSFCVAHPTPRYDALLSGLPVAVVASTVRILVALGVGGMIGRCLFLGAAAGLAVLPGTSAAACCCCCLRFGAHVLLLPPLFEPSRAWCCSLAVLLP